MNACKRVLAIAVLGLVFAAALPDAATPSKTSAAARMGIARATARAATLRR